MTSEQQANLVKRFPFLYRGCHKSIRVSCMPFGFEVGSGWYHIIYSLSLAIESELKYIHPWYVRKFYRQIEWASSVWNDFVWLLAKNVKSHLFGEEPIADYKEIIEHTTLRGKLYIFLLRLLHHTSFFEVTQVKEKFGILRYYTNWETEEIGKHITVACHASHNTCEDCGLWGEANEDGWITTLCDTCREKRDKRWSHSTQSTGGC